MSSAFRTTCARNQVLVLVAHEVVDGHVARLAVAVDAAVALLELDGFHGQSKCSR